MTTPNNNGIVIGVIVALVAAGIGFMAYQSMGSKQPVAPDGNKMMVSVSPEPTESMAAQKEGVMVGGQMMVPSRDIIDNAVLANNVTTVVAAVKAAGLVDTLKGDGPFTVFAPTNAAFDALPAGTVDTLLKPENKEKLTSILTYHVVAGRYTSADLQDGQMLTTVNGQSLKITKKNGMIMVNNATVETPDVISSNGVTFVVDTVLMPK